MTSQRLTQRGFDGTAVCLNKMCDDVKCGCSPLRHAIYYNVANIRLRPLFLGIEGTHMVTGYAHYRQPASWMARRRRPAGHIQLGGTHCTAATQCYLSITRADYCPQPRSCLRVEPHRAHSRRRAANHPLTGFRNLVPCALLLCFTAQ